MRRLWLVGGRDVRGERDVFSYDPAADTWREEPPAPRPCAWGAATAIGGELVISGGAIGRCCSDRSFARGVPEGALPPRSPSAVVDR